MSLADMYVYWGWWYVALVLLASLLIASAAVMSFVLLALDNRYAIYRWTIARLDDASFAMSRFYQKHFKYEVPPECPDWADEKAWKEAWMEFYDGH